MINRTMPTRKSGLTSFIGVSLGATFRRTLQALHYWPMDWILNRQWWVCMNTQAVWSVIWSVSYFPGLYCDWSSYCWHGACLYTSNYRTWLTFNVCSSPSLADGWVKYISCVHSQSGEFVCLYHHTLALDTQYRAGSPGECAVVIFP